MNDDYVRSVTVLDVIDGDTFRCDVDLGFYVRARMLCRLVGLNAPELSDPGGTVVRAMLSDLLHGAQSVSVRSVRTDKYAGRFDAVVTIVSHGPPLNVNQTLIDMRYAVPWDGHGSRPAVPWPP